MLSLRLPPNLELQLKQISEAEEVSKSEIVKRALINYFEKCQKKQSPYDAGKELFGRHGSGRGDLSVRRKKILKEKLNEKHSR